MTAPKPKPAAPAGKPLPPKPPAKPEAKTAPTKPEAKPKAEDKKDEKKEEPVKVPPFIKAVTDNLASRMGSIDDDVAAMIEASVKPGVKPQVLLEKMEGLLVKVDMMGLHLARECAKMRGTDEKDTNPLVKVSAVNIVRELRNAAREVEGAPWAPSAYNRAAKNIKEAVGTLNALSTLLTGAGVADCVVLPGTPLVMEGGTPLVDLKTGEANPPVETPAAPVEEKK